MRLTRPGLPYTYYWYTTCSAICKRLANAPNLKKGDFSRHVTVQPNLRVSSLQEIPYRIIRGCNQDLAIVLVHVTAPTKMLSAQTRPVAAAQLSDRKSLALPVLDGHATASVAALASRFSMGPLEISALGVHPCDPPRSTSAIEASVVSPSSSALIWNHMPGRVHADRPLEVKVTAVELDPEVGATALVARWLSAHALLTIEVDVEGQQRASYTCPLAVHSSACGWLARALIRPSAWVNAASVAVVSLTLAGQSISCDCIPAIQRVGYNHGIAPAGAVFRAARAGDVAALQAALDAGGSTAEKDEVRGGGHHFFPS